MQSLKNVKLARWVWMVLCLYVVALTCSIAGMELGAALMTLTAVFVVLNHHYLRVIAPKIATNSFMKYFLPHDYGTKKY